MTELKRYYQIDDAVAFLSSRSGTQLSLLDLLDMFIRKEIKLFFLYTGLVVNVPKYNPVLRTGVIDGFENYIGYVQIHSHTADDLRPLILDKECALVHSVDIIKRLPNPLPEDDIIGPYLLAWSNKSQPSIFMHNDYDDKKSRDGWQNDPDWRDTHDDSSVDFNAFNAAVKVAREDLLISTRNLEQLLSQESKSSQSNEDGNEDGNDDDIPSRTKPTIFIELKMAARVVAKLSGRQWQSNNELAVILMDEAAKADLTFPIQARSLAAHLSKA